ncbi:molybdenum cofactor guanylyltransferase [Corynebacterium senegalense]|uniref:molybdenum cofactor guanylyltransferase n=1 Tax=Corynebacterium senegalense TaxID=2080750 RepID=UPI000E2006CB|nr:molybdenum cofactor guanylyltransferase [Corynebacterium senegalense]
MGVVVLAGGRSTRMGADKARVRVGGRRLVDKLLDALPAPHPVIVVSPEDLGVPTVSEDPPYGGPVAGIAAGARALDTPFVAVVAVDAPHSPGLLPALSAALGTHDCAAIVSADGAVQPLCALWRRDSLLAALDAVGARDAAAMKLLRAAGSVALVDGDGRERDFDTPGELSELGDVDLGDSAP